MAGVRFTSQAIRLAMCRGGVAVFRTTGVETFSPASGLITLQVCNYRTKWEKLRSVKKPTPPKFDYSGDNTLDLPVNLDKTDSIFTQYGVDTDGLVDEEMQLFSVQNADSQERLDLLIKKIKQMFQRDHLDTQSLECKIAMGTVHIRRQINHMYHFPKDKHTKSNLVEAIQLRTKQLKQLNRFDIERFNWVLKELDLTYIPTTVYNKKRPMKSKVRLEAVEEMMKTKDSKLAALRESLAAEREEYYSKKSEIMEAVLNEKDALAKEHEELSRQRIDTGYLSNNGEIAYKLAHIKPVDKEKWWKGHPAVIDLVYKGRKPTNKGRVRKSQKLANQ